MRVNEHLCHAHRRRTALVHAGAGHSSTLRPDAAPVIRRGRLQADVARWPVHVFAEADYCWGLGPLALRLHRIEWQRPVPYDGDTWLEVEGTVIDRGTGRPGPRREVLVRAAILPKMPPRRRPRLRA
ncbi:hypothetical protein [Actinoplanes sp. RD1]|uniref:hypothetical protein n=1 Tax=Actinoplanes sp. RD1 TaxID=3064538 RepID=UPI00274176C7|nr:hypothetical protein [Actinoplanes sp. RD1]